MDPLTALNHISASCWHYAASEQMTGAICQYGGVEERDKIQIAKVRGRERERKRECSMGERQGVRLHFEKCNFTAAATIKKCENYLKECTHKCVYRDAI